MPLAYPFLLAYLLDLLLGDPPSWPHPVKLMGYISTFWEKVYYRPKVLAGAVFWAVVLATISALLLLGYQAIMLLPPWAGPLVYTYLLYACLATRSLHRESQRVEKALGIGDLDEARRRLAMIVGRETAQLTQKEVRRAVVETVAENLSDGVVAPMFYCLCLGLPGMLLYKAANTLDSMVGYKNVRYAEFGRVAARVDDALNFLPARLTALLLVLAAAILGLDSRRAWFIVGRDARKPSSPNAGWPEAAMAGALGVRLGGPSTYFGVQVKKPYIGEAITSINESHYHQAVRLLYTVSLIMAALTFLTLLLTGAGLWGLVG
ncbi:MAG: adenosylcobinamide-phosphate synthase CbiB [Thermodesulfobacteriota bacterium]